VLEIQPVLFMLLINFILLQNWTYLLKC
jgi:hypothetical protein